MTTLLLVRHGETDWNAERRWQGWADPPLNEAGRAQARDLTEQLRHTQFDAAYSSDLRRAHETAEIIAAAHGVPVVADQRLREVNIGSWSGLLHSEVAERYADGVRPDGETHEEHAARVREVVEEIVRDNPEGRILVVTHGGSIRAFLGASGDVPAAWLPNCGFLEVQIP